MVHFPLFINLNHQPVLVVGGGAVALRKIKKLLPYGPEITVAAPEISEDIPLLPNVTLQRRAFLKEDLDLLPAVVIAASDDPELNRHVAALCRERRIPVNVADNPEECSFLFPALVTKGSFSAGICTGGSSPTAAVYYKERLNELLPERLEEILEWLEEKRLLLKKEIPQQTRRAGIFRQLFDACAKKQRPLTEEEYSSLTILPKAGSVALVGAGCGSADLITVRGLRLLQQCEAVVYDDLIDPELLDSVPETALRIYMGKRSGNHSAPQDEINKTLIELAGAGLKVVRLKGGDPYLFGRGGEEMLALKEAGISCREVPGIPSAIGIAAEAGIPVTHRGISRGLHIVTAHTSDTEDKLPSDFDSLAGLSGTLVFLMGLKQLPLISERLIAAGKSPDTPAAVLSGGNSPHPARVHAPLSGIAEAAKEAGVSAPAIIMVGEVTALNLSADEKSLLEMAAALKTDTGMHKPLSGVTVGITGTEAIARKQMSLFENAGAECSWISRAEVVKLPFSFSPDIMTSKLHWLVFTSANGVNIFFRHLEETGLTAEKLLETGQFKFAVIGSATGKMLETFGITADLCPDTFTGEGLADVLIQTAGTEDTILLLRSEIGSPVLPMRLREAGFSVQDIPIYKPVPVPAETDHLSAPDYITFSSANGVDLFFRQYGHLPEHAVPVCIGTVTAKALSKYGHHCLLAKDISAEGLLQAVLEDHSADRSC